MLSGSVCEKLSLVNSWWHHAFWLCMWKIEPSEQLMTLFSGSTYDKSEPSLPGCKMFSGCWLLFFVHVKFATTAVFREEYPWKSLLQQILLQNLIRSETQKIEVFSVVVVVSAYLFETGLEKKYIDSLHPSVMVLHWPRGGERRNGNPVLYSVWFHAVETRWEWLTALWFLVWRFLSCDKLCKVHPPPAPRLSPLMTDTAQLIALPNTCSALFVNFLFQHCLTHVVHCL